MLKANTNMHRHQKSCENQHQKSLKCTQFKHNLLCVNVVRVKMNGNRRPIYRRRPMNMHVQFALHNHNTNIYYIDTRHVSIKLLFFYYENNVNSAENVKTL